MNKLNLALVGFFQALGLIIYCALVSGLFWFFKNFFIAPAGFLGTVLMLILFVFSAAVTGSIVFGYPAYLSLNKKTKQALFVLAYTLLFCLGVIAIIIVFFILY